MSDEIKIGYRGIGGFKSKAYVSESTGMGTDKYTDEDVTVAWDDDGKEWVEIAPLIVTITADTRGADDE